MGWYPCTCCESCDILSDTFDRADDTDLGANWTETAGSWAIASNLLETSSASAIALTTASPPVDNGINLTVSFTANQDGDTARFIFNYTDSNNYNYIEFKAGTGAYNRIYERSGGVDTLLRSVSVSRLVGFTSTVAACYFDGLIIISGDTASVSTSLDGGDFGLGTGALTGTMKFDDFLVRRLGGSCSNCTLPCDGGCIGTTPGMMEVTCSGIGAIACAAGNGTFVLENPFCTVANTTRWLYGTGAALNTFPHWRLDVVDNGAMGVPRRSVVLIYQQSLTRSVGFRLDEAVAADGYDCPNISTLNIPFNSSTNCGAIGTPIATLRAL